MKVKDIMTHEVKTCTPEMNLAAAAMIMWDNDCGVVPVVSSEGKVIGVITDRDICMAGATQNRKTSEVAVREVFTGNLYACAPDDDIRNALKIMSAERVRRLPVINAYGVLEGILSLNDIVLHVQAARLDGVRDIGDPLFSTWRLAWIAHQLPRAPLHDQQSHGRQHRRDEDQREQKLGP